MLAPVLFNIFLLYDTQLIHKEMDDSSGVSVDYRFDGNLFNIRRLQTTTKLLTFTADNYQLSVVPSFRYLGSILSEDTTIDNDVQNRIKQASAASGSLRRRVFQNKDLKDG